jgi:hypothetical protein
VSDFQPGNPVRCRGHIGTIVREHNAGWYIIRFDDDVADKRPGPGQELVQAEIVAYIGEIEKLV